MLEAIISAGDASSYLRFTQLIPTLRVLAVKRLGELRERLQMSTISLLDTRLGTRKVRSFRLLRFRDARSSDYGDEDQFDESNQHPPSKADRCRRSVILKVWDYEENKQGNNTLDLREGDHFKVSRERGK
jgi:hypothetical protein